MKNHKTPLLHPPLFLDFNHFVPTSQIPLQFQFPKNPPSPSGSDRPSPSPEIDLAAVFANFLNQSNTGSETNENSSGSSSLEIDCENPCDLIDESRFGDVLPRIEDDVEEFMGDDEWKESGGMGFSL